MAQVTGQALHYLKMQKKNNLMQIKILMCTPKCIFMFLLITFLLKTGNCIVEYKPGDTLYVWATSGLNIRAAANANAKVVGKIGFGEMVLSRAGKNWNLYQNESVKIKDVQAIHGERTKTITLRGNWAMITYNDIEGFVFDAYLSKLKPPDHNESSSFFEAFKEEFGIVKYIEQKDSLSENSKNRILLGNGAVMDEYRYATYRSFYVIVPYFSIEEALLIIRKLDNYAEDIIQSNENTIKIRQEIGGYEIRSYENSTIISAEWGC